MKIKLSVDDELYPVIVTSKEHGKEFEVPDNVAKEFIDIENKYFEAQKKMEKIIEKAYEGI